MKSDSVPHTYEVALREFAPLGATLHEHTYPTGTIPTEHFASRCVSLTATATGEGRAGFLGLPHRSSDAR
jgi:hypothetical protein